MTASARQRDALAEIVRDPNTSPIKVLGAAIGFLRLTASSNAEIAVADAADAAIKNKIRELAPHLTLPWNQ